MTLRRHAMPEGHRKSSMFFLSENDAGFGNRFWLCKVWPCLHFARQPTAAAS